MDSTITVSIVGAVTTTIGAVLAWAGNRRAKDRDALIQMFDQVRKWSLELQESEERCREQLAAERELAERELAAEQRRAREVEMDLRGQIRDLALEVERLRELVVDDGPGL